MNNLEKALYATHYEAARRQNASTQVLIAAFQSNGNDVIKSITAALQCFGGKHAPVKEIYKMITSLQSDETRTVLSKYKSIPGFGSSFTKERDTLLDLVDAELIKQTKIYERIAIACKDYLIRYKGIILHPNLGFYTAAVMHYEQVPIDFCECIMIRARIECWTQILEGKEMIHEHLS
jgi:citrate synthase